MNINEQERISALSHGLLIIPFIAGTVVLGIFTVHNSPVFISSILYGLSATFLFIASFLYHLNKKEENENSVWRRLDHIAIFVLIAGTYTPVCMVYLDGQMTTAIISIQWLLVACGVFYKIFFINTSRILGTLIYILMGWVVIVPLNILFNKMPNEVFFLMAMGGFLYTSGAIIYAVKRSFFRSVKIGFHELFHFFIIGGAVSHFFMIFISTSIQ